LRERYSRSPARVKRGEGERGVTKTRKQELGNFGEDKALELLKRRFDDIDKMPPNFPFFDLMAKQGTRRLLISVRTRNKFTDKGKLKKNNYNLYTKKGHFDSASKVAIFFGAEIVWVAVTVDTKSETKTFSAYMGDVDASKPPLPEYIPMHPDRDVRKHDCLAEDVPDEAISPSWSNIKQTVSGNENQP
jgi:hypothetical protein